jgi:hypothetical protein
MQLFAEWLEPDAKFRLEITAGVDSEHVMLEIGGNIYPDNFRNAVIVRSDDGSQLAHHIDLKTNILCYEAPPKGQRTFVYFGFETAQASSTWDEKKIEALPENARLQLRATETTFDDIKENDIMRDKDYKQYLKIKKMENNIKMSEYLIKRLKKINTPQNNIQDKNIVTSKISEENETQMRNLKNDISEKRAKIAKIFKSELINLPKLKTFKDRDRKLENHFSIKNDTRDFEIKELKETRIEKHMIKKMENENAIRMQGRIKIDKVGIYEFAINSTSYSLLCIDDIPIVEWPYVHPKSADWQRIGQIELDPGIHSFRFFAHIGKKSEFAAAAWKKPGETDFHIMRSEDFMPPNTRPLNFCTNKDGKIYPLIKAESLGKFFLDRTHTMDWIECEFLSHTDEIYPTWLIGDNLISKQRAIQFLDDGQNKEFMHVKINEALGDKNNIKITLSQITRPDKIIEPNIALTVRTPIFIFDDETLRIDLELYSEMPQKSIVLLKTDSFPKNDNIPKIHEWLELPQRDLENGLISTPKIFSKEFQLDGRKIASIPLHLRFSVSIIPIEICEESISFIPLEQCSEFPSEDGIFLYNKGGRKLVPVLHRPSLAEKRTWSFSDAIIREVKNSNKILIVADEFGTEKNLFSNYLQKLFARKDIKTHFVSWTPKHKNSSMLCSLGPLINQIRNSDASKIIIIPSSYDTDAGVSARTQSRIISAVLQTSRKNHSINEIFLCSPIPSTQENEIETELIKYIKHNLKDDFAINKIIDINEFVKKQANWQSYYREELNSPALTSILPVHMVEQISQMIIDSN